MSATTKTLSTIMPNNSSSDYRRKRILTSLFYSPASYFSKKLDTLASKLDNLRWEKRLQNAGIPKANQIFTYTNNHELKTLYNLASNCCQGSVALEIGSHLGASSCYLAAGLAQVNGHLFCVDTWQNETMPEGDQDTFAEFQKNINGVNKQITAVKKRSDEISTYDIQVPLNLVFIDGDHSYTSVKKDFDCVQQWLAEDGIIAFHDFSISTFPGVTRVIGEALASGKWMFVGCVDTLVWIKRARWTKPTWIKES